MLEGVGTKVDQAWAECARRVGFSIRRITDRTHVFDNFGAMVRSLGDVAQPGDDLREGWMLGRHVDLPVLVVPTFPRRQRLGTAKTEIIAPIDPPLLLGLHMTSVALLHGQVGPDADVGHAALDAGFEIAAFVRARATRLLGGEAGRWEHASRLLALRSEAQSIAVTDNMVHTRWSGLLTEPSLLGARVATVAALARALAAERASMPYVDDELPDRSWAAFADAERMRFDRARMQIAGDFRGVAGEVRLCTGAGAAYTTARAILPVRLGIGLRLTAHTSNDGVTTCVEDDENDIELGDPVFDETFCVEASDEARARGILADPALRAIALEVMQHSGELVVTDTTVSCTVRHPLRDAGHLEWVLQRLTALARLLARADTPPAVPYR